MPRAPKKPQTPETPHTPLGYTAGTSAGDALTRLQKLHVLHIARSSTGDGHKSIDLYLDYNRVLNSEGLEALNEFMDKLDHIDVLNLKHSDVVRIILLSHRRCPQTCYRTLNELAEAGVLNMFHDIVFTAKRSGYQQGDLEPYRYNPREPRYNRRDSRSPRSQYRDLARMLVLNDCQKRTYHWFTGSKDAYIAQFHEEESTRIIFADDNKDALQEVKTRHPYATCIWMHQERMQKMLHAENLQQLYRIILAASIMIRENSMAIQLESAPDENEAESLESLESL